MKLSLNFKLGSLTDILKKNLSFVLLGFLIFIAILVGFVIYGELRKISDAKGNSANAAQIVRVNLDAHKQLEKKLNDNSTFEPKVVEGADSFGTAPTKTN